MTNQQTTIEDLNIELFNIEHEKKQLIYNTFYNLIIGEGNEDQEVAWENFNEDNEYLYFEDDDQDNNNLVSVKRIKKINKEHSKLLKLLKIEPKEENKNCLICLEEIKNEKIKKCLQCKVLYHYNCIKEWFRTTKTCPHCRGENFKTL